MTIFKTPINKDNILQVITRKIMLGEVLTQEERQVFNKLIIKELEKNED